MSPKAFKVFPIRKPALHRSEGSVHQIPPLLSSPAPNKLSRFICSKFIHIWPTQLTFFVFVSGVEGKLATGPPIKHLAGYVSECTGSPVPWPSKCLPGRFFSVCSGLLCSHWGPGCIPPPLRLRTSANGSRSSKAISLYREREWKANTLAISSWPVGDFPVI